MPRPSRCAASTSRALAEQATTADEIARSADGLARMVGTVTRGMNEQASAVAHISTATDSMRVQSDQAVRALKEQSRAVRELTGATQNTATQIRLIASANAENAAVVSRVGTQLREIRDIAERNARSVREPRGGTDALLRHAEELAGILHGSSNGRSHGPRAGANGRG